MVIGTRINPRSASAFRDAQIQFLDTAGNAFIRFGGVLIDVRGRTESDAIGQLRTSPRLANIFSRTRAQIVLALLTWPEILDNGVRLISATAGVSLGQAHAALAQLTDAGFLAPGSRRPLRTGELIDFWTAAYPTGLGPQLRLGEYHGDPGRPLRSDRPLHLSGEAAQGVDITRPAALTLYVDAMDSRLPMANRWSTNPDRVHNIFVRRKFWTSPHPDVEVPAATVQNAPWPLVYADLLATGDARLAEVARTWRENNAGPGQG